MNALLRGAISGAIATVPMTVPILAAQRLGLFRTPPPEQISDKVAWYSNFLPERSEPGFTPVWLGAHLGYGAACGAIYTLARPVLPGPGPVAGVLFGGAVWGVGYLGFLPALDLYPAPEDDATPRTATMILAHAVFGIALATLDQRLRLRG